MTASILPRNRPGAPTGALVVRDSNGTRSIPAAVNPDVVYTPPSGFTIDGCDETALPSDCTARIDPEQMNAIVSEMLALIVELTPEGTFDCDSVTNLATAFAAWSLANISPQVRVASTMRSSAVAARLTGLKISSGTSARFQSLYRSRDSVSEVNPYFMCAAMTLAPAVFSTSEIKAACAAVIDRCLVSPRANSTAYGQYALVQFASSGKVFFVNIAGTSAGSQPSDAGITAAGQFLSDGTITLEYTGIVAPTSWAWWIADINGALTLPTAPDSNDAYAGMLCAATLAGAPDSTWLGTTSAHGVSRITALANAVSKSITDETVSGLVRTFQGGVKLDGSSYAIKFLADNVEAWRGLTALASLHTTAGDASSASARTTQAATLKTAIISNLWDGAFVNADASVGRWKYYTGDTGDITFAKSRFHLWPVLHGLLATESEIATYGVPAVAYTMAEVPGLWNEALDDFPLSEWYFAAHMIGVPNVTPIILRRCIERAAANVVIQDLAIALRVLSSDLLAASALAGLSDKQPLHTLLTAISGLTVIKGSLIGGTGASTLAVLNTTGRSNGDQLVVDSGSATGFGWATASASTLASAAEAVAGTNDTKYMSPYKTALAFGPDVRALAMMVSELKGDRINMPNGIFDPLADTGDVTTTTNGDAGVAGKITPTFSYSAATGGSNIGSMTSGGGLAGAFDSTTNQAAASGARLVGSNGYTNTVGKDWGVGQTKIIRKFVLWCPNDDGFRGDAAAIGYKFQGSNDNSNWTDLATGTLPSGTNQGSTTVTSGIDTSTAYRYHRINLNGNGSSSVNLAELELYTGTFNNMTLISAAFTAASAPTRGRLTVQAKPIDAITINTDLVGSISRDGGTTWTAATLAAETTLADGTILYVHDGLDISAQPSGTSMKWKIVTANSKNIEINGIGLRWL